MPYFSNEDQNTYTKILQNQLNNNSPAEKPDLITGGKDKHKLYLNNADIIFVVLDRSFRVQFINERGASIIGLPAAEIKGKNWFRHFVSLQAHGKSDYFSRLFFNNENKIYEYFEAPLILSGGEQKLVAWSNTVINDKAGELAGIISTGMDISDQKRAEKIQRVISSILTESNFEANLNELFRFIHNEVKELIPVKNFYIALYDNATELITFPYFIDETENYAPPQKFDKGLTEYVIKTGKAVLVDFDFNIKLQKENLIKVIGTPAKAWLGIPLKIKDNTIGVLVVQDYENEKTIGEKEKEILEMIAYPISRAIERKFVEQEKNNLISELKKSNASKDRLLSLISHDLRSPFNSLLGFSEILATEYDTLTQEEIKEYLGVIFDSSKVLYGMTTNLLQFSRSQMGRLEYSPEKLNLEDMVEYSLKLLKVSIVKKSLKVYVDIHSSINIAGDRELVHSIFCNLLSNAIKFTGRNGEINISAVSAGNFAIITVEDNGTGISKEAREKLFKDIVPSTPGTEREYGTGIGLMLVKEFIELHNGTITVESAPGAGSRFIFTLPLA